MEIKMIKVKKVTWHASSFLLQFHCSGSKRSSVVRMVPMCLSAYLTTSEPLTYRCAQGEPAVKNKGTNGGSASNDQC